MAIVYCIPVFEGALTGASAPQTSPANMNGTIAQAERFFLQARVTQVAGTSPSITVTLEHSNDDVNFTTKSTLINGTALTANQQNNIFAQDLGTAQVGGCSMRVSVSLGGTTPSAYVQLYLCGRSND